MLSSKVKIQSVSCFFVSFHVAADRFLKSPFHRVFFSPSFVMFVKYVDVILVQLIHALKQIVVVSYYCCLFLHCS
jgi:hypothetical protein